MSLAPKRDIHPALALMETPEHHKESGDGEYTPKRVLCATETVVTDNEDDNEEPLNVPSEASRDVSPRRPGDPLDQSSEFYKTIHGFKAFCRWFFHTYPGYFVSPLRISGSAVESLFSQYKYTAGGKLDSANYASSRCAHLVKQSVAPHHSGKHYRDESTAFMELPLIKKEYNKSSSS